MRQNISNYILNTIIILIYCVYTVPCCILLHLCIYLNNILYAKIYLASQIGEFVENAFYSLFLDK